LTYSQRLFASAASAVAITIGVSFIPDFSINGMSPLAASITLSIAGICLAFAAPAWLISSLLGGQGLDRSGHFQMPLLGRFLLAIQLTAFLYAVSGLVARWRRRRSQNSPS
jgi:hypothetical protein